MKKIVGIVFLTLLLSNNLLAKEINAPNPNPKIKIVIKK